MDPQGILHGREAEIAAFERLVEGDGRNWVMLVDGLSGTGKSFLADWLAAKYSGSIPAARLLLSPSVNEENAFRLVAGSLGSRIVEDYDRGIAKLARREEARTLVEVEHAPKAEISARRGGSITGASQEANVNVDVGSFGEVLKAERRARRLDVLVDALSPMRERRWVLFVDETEHLEGPELARLVLDDLVGRLRASFPDLRLYLTGQKVPTSRFPRGERISCSLDTFSNEVTEQLFVEAGVSDADTLAAFREITGGHPLLVGMSLEYIGSHGDHFSSRELESLREKLSERARTEWIYDGILDRLPDGIREVAASLALFEWFDLGILRKVFGEAITEESFRDLEQRSFVKRLPDGSLRCHDIVREHLAPLRLEQDREAARGLLDKAIAAYMEELVAEVERQGSLFIERRVHYTTAAFHAALQLRADTATNLMLNEIGLALSRSQDDYVFSLIRVLEDAEDLKPPLDHLASRARRCLERINAGLELDRENLRLLEELAQHAEVAVTADWLRYRAALWASAAGLHELAVRYAASCLEHEDDLENRLLQAQVHAAAGQPEEARRMIAEARQAHGESACLRIGEGDIELSLGNGPRALGIFLGLRNDFPEAAPQAELRIARMQIEEGAQEEALETLRRLEEREGPLPDARTLRAEALIRSGRFEDLLADLNPTTADLSNYADLLLKVEQAFGDPAARARFVTEFKLSPAKASIGVVLALCDLLSYRGDHQTVGELAAVATRQWPEAGPTFQGKVAAALLRDGRLEEAKELLDVLRATGSHPDVVFLLAAYHRNKGDGVRERELLLEAREQWPQLNDVVDPAVAGSFMTDEQLDQAADYLDQVEAAEGLGPRGRRMLALVSAQQGNEERALKELERLIYTEERSAVSAPEMAQGRSLYASLLLSTGRAKEAREATDAMVDLFGRLPAAAKQAVELYVRLDDEAGLRRLLELHGVESEVGTAVVGQLARMIASQGLSVESLVKAIELQPERLELLVALQLVLVNQGSLEEAGEIMDRLETRVPGAYRRLTELSRTWEGHFAAVAPALYAKLQAVDPAELSGADAAIFLNLVQVLASSGRLPLAEALQDIDRLAAAKSEVAASCQAAAVGLLLEAGRTQDAGRRLAPFIAEQPVPPTLLWEPITKYHRAQKDVERQIDLWERVAAARPRARRSALERVVDLKIGDRPGEALELIEKLEAEAPLDGGLQISRANALAKLSREPEAIRILEAVVSDTNEVEPIRGLAALRLGRLHKEAGRAPEAVAVLRSATELRPKDALAWERLAYALKEHEEWSESLEALLTSVSLEPGSYAKHEPVLAELQVLARQQQPSGGGSGSEAPAA